MSQPQAYERTTDFTERDGDDSDHPALNQELDAAALSINQIRDNLALIQRDDGALKNGVVTADALAPSAFDAVLVSVNVAVGEAETAALSALISATTANAARDQALSSAGAALTSQTASALNAGVASTAAGAASVSQIAAAASAAAALVSETNADTSEAAALASQTAAGLSAAAALADKNASAVSAAAALVSANNAAVSEAAALASQTAAGVSATAADASKIAAAASAASINLPGSLVGKLLNFLRVKADESGYEHRTAAQVKADIITAGSVGQADLATAVLPLGVGQTWQNVGRSNGVNYTNSTGRTIVAQYAFSGGSGLTGQFTIDGFVMATGSSGSTASGMQFVAVAEIPNGAVYSFYTNGNFVSAQELRPV